MAMESAAECMAGRSSLETSAVHEHQWMEASWMKNIDSLPYFLSYSFPLLALAGIGTNRPYLFLVLILAWYMVLVLLDFALGVDRQYPFEKIRRTTGPRPSPLEARTLILYGYILLHATVLVTVMFRILQAEDPLPWLLYAIPVSISGGLALGVGHELFHRSSFLQMFFARMASIPQFWTPDEFEHLYMHHREEITSTEQDPVFARKGQSAYSFMWHALTGVVREGWRVRTRILHEAGARYAVGFNALIRLFGPSVFLLITVAFLAGLLAAVFLLLQALLSISLFILTIYQQHYGLARREMGDGNLEPYTYMNVWSSDRVVSNRLHFNIPRHAHHHSDPHCRYYDLKLIEESPMLPMGYLPLLLVALIPPLWYRLMDPLIAEIYDRRDRLEQEGRLQVETS